MGTRSPKKRKPGDTCDIPGCGRPFVARGMCRTHYVAWYRATPKHLRTPALGLSRMTIEERFWSKVDQSGGQEACWPWQGSCHRSGHGVYFVSRERDRVPAHSFAVELTTGQRCPQDKECCHHCDNPPCCNPQHLYYGTRQQNVNDTWTRGRGRRGSRHPSAQLSEQDVMAIRKRYAAGETTAALAEEFPVSEGGLYAIVTGRNWKHVGGPIVVIGSRRKREILYTDKDVA